MKQLTPPHQVNEYQYTGKIIGKGLFGTVALYKNKYQDLVVIKFEHCMLGNAMLQESINLRNLKKLIQSRDLQEEISIPNGLSFYQIVGMMFKSIKQLHDLGYLHRNIHPDNFRVQNNKIYLIAFGSSIKYIDEHNQHIPEQRNKKLVGIHDVASIFTQQGIEPSRRDDYISAAYSLLLLRHEHLPWQKENQEQLHQLQIQTMIDDKLKIMYQSPYNNIEDKAIISILNYLHCLEFEDEPEIEEIQSLFCYLQ
ncbi:casein kinase i [Stylonychia lemnae]|uniref:Casein kinase I n=1 Tax=Stylonychia lemnae TaxID=5949 RepID=A0A078A4Q5_STYLE|nr:casein kinase i [Stylonychia lemnae]|eukprot:CDW76489.1 casein kinase i [Stylonychia lemnae]